jgi:hypothetical protein
VGVELLCTSSISGFSITMFAASISPKALNASLRSSSLARQLRFPTYRRIGGGGSAAPMTRFC